MAWSPLLYLFFQGLLCPPLLRPHLLRSAPGPEEVRRANTFVSYPGMQGTWEYSSGQRYVHGFERTLVLSAMFWCFRKRTGLKQPNLMSRAGIASAQPKKGAARAPKKKAAPGQRPEMKAASQQDPQLDTSRADGVMVLLSKRIPANQVRWREIRKGRLLQVIFPWMGTRVHLAAVYQHAWSSKKTNQQNKEDRAKLLGEISSLIRSIPCRNTFLLAGDFNARLSPHEGLIGPCSTAAEATNLQDESLQALVTSHGLIALNTWSSGQGHTFIQNASRSPKSTSSSLRLPRPQGKQNRRPLRVTSV